MSAAVQPTPAPNVELELAKLANDAMASGADPHEVTQKLHQTISYLRQFPKMAERATNALADGVASPADISRTLWPHVSAIQHATGSNAPTEEEAANLPVDVTARSRFGGGLASFASGIPGGEALTTGVHALVNREPWSESLRDVRAAESTSPIGTPLKVAGALATGRVIPGSNLAKGAIYGATMGYTDPDPDADRRQEVIQNGILGGLFGAGADVVGAIGSKVGSKIAAQSDKERELATAIGSRAKEAYNRFRGTPINRPAVRIPSSSPLRPGTVPGLVGNTPPEVTPGTSPTSIEEMLQSMVGKLRLAQPGEIGNQVGDAELAMRRSAPAPQDLEDLLRRSILAKGGQVAPVP